jgi:hypothetical protein
MSSPLVHLKTAIQAARQLGLVQVASYASYQAGLRSGLYRLLTPTTVKAQGGPIRSPFGLPDVNRLRDVWKSQPDGPPDPSTELITEADEIAAGSMRLFGETLAPLALKPPDASMHWTDYEGKPARWGVEDLKYIWEPARFGWVYPLGRAYLLTGSEIYPATFWQHLEIFISENPPNRGLNWASAQEVALRLLALLFALGVFERSPETTPERVTKLAAAVEVHARRIPATLQYARAQNNNHLVSEALGLFAAAYALPEYRTAKSWHQIGRYWFNQALQGQIAADGTYTQHSMNYHRLMLHAALQAQLFGMDFAPETKERLASAARWLLAQVDPISGRAPNLGSNDGAHILPLAAGGFSDYRPVAQAASRAFLGEPAFSPGPWDELGLWLGQELEPVRQMQPFPSSPAVQRLGDAGSWASLRCARFDGRPSHADQLHVELWWRGENLALDAGTYRYTASQPWDNALARTIVHNTVEIDEQDQMRRAGRFLWLDWAQAEVITPSPDAEGKVLSAQHDGYARLGVLHRRTLEHSGSGHWKITDHLLPAPGRERSVNGDMLHAFRLHWLLPDWPWSLDGSTLTLSPTGGGQARLSIYPLTPVGNPAWVGEPCLVRAGESLAGAELPLPILGWHAPTYGKKLPALSFYLPGRVRLPFILVSEWRLSG